MGFNADWFLRLGVAATFLYHGFSKFPVAPMMGLGTLEVTVLAIVEITIGLLILAGTFAGSLVTRISALLILPIMIGAIVKTHWPRWSFTPAPPEHPIGGMEFQVLLILVALFFLVRGNGSSIEKQTI